MTATVPPAFDPEISQALREFSDVIVTQMSPEDIARVRASGEPTPSSALTHHGRFLRMPMTAPGHDGRPDVPVVLYEPAHRTSGSPMPAIAHIHGGGLVAGTVDSDVPAAVELAAETGCVVVSIDYRLAPEHPYPAALHDVDSVLRWLTGPESPPVVDTERVFLSGVSAGGGLAAAAALLSRDDRGAHLAGAMLACPMLDHRSSSGSAMQMQGLGSWDRIANLTGWQAYLGDLLTAGDEIPAYASPAMCTDLRGLPPLFIDVGSAETFRDECVDFASAVWRAGGDAELHVWPGGVHGFEFLAPWADISRRASASRVAWLRRRLSRL